MMFNDVLQEGFWNGGDEVFGHEYLAKFHNYNLEECANLDGVDLDLLKKKTCVIVTPLEGGT